MANMLLNYWRFIVSEFLLQEWRELKKWKKLKFPDKPLWFKTLGAEDLIMNLAYFVAVHICFHYFCFSCDYCMQNSLTLESKWRELLDHLEWLFKAIHGVQWF